jgi:hypothetical protein
MNQTYIAHGPAIAARNIGGEMLVMSCADSTFFNLNAVATILWEAADGRTALRQIVENKVCPAFEVDLETAYEDAKAFVAELSQHGVLVVSETPISQGGVSGAS